MSWFWTRFSLFVLLLLLSIRVFTTWSSESIPLWVWGFGLLADVAALAMLCGVVALAALSRFQWLRSTVVGIMMAVIVIVAVAEVFFWHEFQSRLDRLVFHYLAYPVEVLTFLEEQFYIAWIVVPLVLLIVGLTRMLGRLPQMQVGTVLVLVTIALVVGVFVRQPILDQSRPLNQMASNGYIGVLTAATVNPERWPSLFPGVTPSAEAFKPAAARPPVIDVAARHVVLIIEESFAGRDWLDPRRRAVHLPSFTALSEEGLRFDNVFASGTRTTRGMEAILHGFVPLPGISATERDGFERLPSLPRAFKAHGYQTFFAYGGWPGFSNFTNYWRGVGFDHTSSRYDFREGTFETSWGVNDRDVFTHILEEMDERTQQPAPVFLATLTVSNHRPFIVPAGEPGAEERSLTAAMHYADAALGYFFRQAKLRDWYDDTVFVIVADHAPRIHGDSLIPVESYRVPLLILSSPEVAPQVITERGSSAGIAATLVALFGIGGDEAFRVPSLLDGMDAPAYVEHDYHVGELLADRFTVLARGGTFYGWSVDGDSLQPVGQVAASSVEARRLTEVMSEAHGFLYPR
jgi:Sulfatase